MKESSTKTVLVLFLFIKSNDHQPMVLSTVKEKFFLSVLICVHHVCSSVRLLVTEMCYEYILAWRGEDTEGGLKLARRKGERGERIDDQKIKLKTFFFKEYVVYFLAWWWSPLPSSATSTEQTPLNPAAPHADHTLTIRLIIYTK